MKPVRAVRSLLHRFKGVLVCLCLLVAVQGQAAPIVKVFPNGLTVVYQPDHRAPVVMFSVWYKVGSGQERLGITGISHMLEHMMFRGTKQYPDGEFAQLIAENGGDQGAYTSRDNTFYYEILPKEKLSLAMSLEADRMQHLSLDAKAFAKEHQVVMQERNQSVTSQPIGYAFERFNALAYPGSPYQNPILGWPEDLQQLNVKKLARWYQRWYQPNNAVVIGVGDVSAEVFFRQVKQHFAHIHNHGPIPKHIPHPALKSVGKRSAEVYWGAGMHDVLIGYMAPTIPTADVAWHPYALEVLAYVLVGDSHALLRELFVRDQQLALGVNIDYRFFSRYNTQFMVEAIPVKQDQLAKLQQALVNKLQYLSGKDITPERVESAKNNLIAQRIYSKDSLFSQIQDLGGVMTVSLSPNILQNYQAHIAAITPDQVLAVASLYLNTRNRTIVKLLPAEEGPAAAVAPAIGGPVS